MDFPVISNRDKVIETVKNILDLKHFYVTPILLEGVLYIINKISDYYEEGVKFYPEIVLLSDVNYLEAVQGRWVTLHKGKPSVDEFKRVLKLCAPLAVNNWSIYIVVNDNEMSYGLISAEITESSMSLASQLVNIVEENDPILYIRNVGAKNVELLSINVSQSISNTLDEYTNDTEDNIQSLVDSIISKCPREYNNDHLNPFVFKVIRDALNEGHGNLIAVCDKDKFFDVIKYMSGGANLSHPISLPELLFQDEHNNTNRTSVSIKSNVSLIKSMINHDGITIFSNDGCIMGFHYIVNNNLAEQNESIGGSRTKAFENLKKIDLLTARFFKSQDGKTKFA